MKTITWRGLDADYSDDELRVMGRLRADLDSEKRDAAIRLIDFIHEAKALLDATVEEPEQLAPTGDVFGPALGKFGADAPETSRLAAVAVYPRSGTQRWRIVREVAGAGDHGMTCDEAERVLGLPHQSCSARWNELWHDHGMLEPTSRTRRTRNRQLASVFVVTAAGLAAMRERGDL